MAGYHNFSMSNNAIAAYADGEKPFSKWTKTEIINRLISDDIDPKKVKLIKKLSAKAVKHYCLRKSSWHHTSSHYNKTDFFEIDSDFIENETIETMESWILSDKAKKAKTENLKQEVAPTKAKVIYLEWSGSRRHPKAVEVTAVGEISPDGKWFVEEGYTNKHSTSAKGFRILETL